MKKVASVHRVADDKMTLLWLGSLPYEVSMSTGKKVLRKSKFFEYIVWREGLGFRFFGLVAQSV